ncbi:MAG: hypothetical protein JWQ92_3067, partial [Amnibacterium sp.]|nr:hypothetical protein [Amnibacterium sp.]
MTLDTAPDTRPSTGTIRIVDPATGEPVGEHAAAGPAEVAAAVRRAA